MATKKQREQGTCGVCDRPIRLLKGRLVHHGYLRPGRGYIVGDCFGVGYEPHEVSPKACEDWFKSLVAQEEQLKKAIQNLPGTTRLYVRASELHEKMKELLKEETDPEQWKRALKNALSSLEGSLRYVQYEMERAQRKIVSWQPGDLNRFEEEERVRLQTKEAAAEQKNKELLGRAAEKAMYYRGRARSTVARLEKLWRQATKTGDRSKITDANYLILSFAEGYFDWPHAIVDASLRRVTWDEAKAMLGLDEVWSILGVLNAKRGEYRTQMYSQHMNDELLPVHVEDLRAALPVD